MVPKTTEEATNIAEWLEGICTKEHLSLRQAADRASLSHATLSSIKNGSRPTAATISKLAAAFSNDGPSQKAALEDKLLALCGYRSAVSGITTREPLARLLDKLSGFNDEQLGLIETIIDFCATLGEGPWGETNR